MSSPRVILAIAVAMASFAAGCAPNESRPDGAGPATAELEIGLDDYTIRMNADAVQSGRVELAVRNIGADQHDLQIEADGRTLAKTDELAQGERTTMTADIPAHADVIEVWCTVAGHRSQGMSATLAVQDPETPAQRHGEP